MNRTTSFGKFATLWDEQRGSKGESTSHSVLSLRKLLGSVRGKRIYELACGNGFLARAFVREKAREVWASDLAPELIKIAREQYPSKHICYLTREASNFRDILRNYFYAIIIHQGMFYIKNIPAFLKGIARALKPTGVFIFTLLHPLFPEAQRVVGKMLSMGEPLRKAHE